MNIVTPGLLAFRLLSPRKRAPKPTRLPLGHVLDDERNSARRIDGWQMRGDSMPWTRPNRFVFSLFILAAFFLGMAVHVVVAHDYGLRPTLSDTEHRIILACLTIAAVVVGFARMEIVTRQRTHDLMNGQSSLANQVEQSRDAAEKAAEVVNKRLNGEMDARIQEAVRKELAAQLSVQLPTAIEAAVSKIRAADDGTPKVIT